MSRRIDLDALLAGCADDSFDDGIRIDAELEPVAGPGGPVKPAVYEGGTTSMIVVGRRPGDSEATQVIVIDNVPSQANRLEHALRQHRKSISIPEFLLDLCRYAAPAVTSPEVAVKLGVSPPQRGRVSARLGTRRRGLHEDGDRQGDLRRHGANLRPFSRLVPTGPPIWILQSHLGKKRQNAKHARAWVSEIVGWQPASTETKVLGLKGDALNLSTDEPVTSNPNDRTDWDVGKGGKIEGGKNDKLSEMGHGQVPFMGADAPAASVSFARVTQRATVSFAQLRRVGLGTADPEADSAVRALLVALGLHAHQLAFGRGFALRSGAELRRRATTVAWLGEDADESCDLNGGAATRELLGAARQHAKSVGVPLDGWGEEARTLTPKANLRKAILATWPVLDD